ncbi:dienelactone hydrolase family protein [soil metagenome]
MKTERVTYSYEGTEYIGYLALPAQSGKRPSVLIAHEGPGLGPQVEERANQLAELGYVAFACDYVGGGQVLAGMPEMLAKLGSLRGNLDLVRGLARAGLAQLTARPECDASKVAAIGYCFGGTFVLELARSGADTACTVGFHSGLETKRPEDAKNIKGPVLVCIGADDPLIPPAQRAAFEEEMRAAGRIDWRMELYGNAVHGFANPLAGNMRSPAAQYDKKAHLRSWASMLALFAETIG